MVRMSAGDKWKQNNTVTYQAYKHVSQCKSMDTLGYRSLSFFSRCLPYGFVEQELPTRAPGSKSAHESQAPCAVDDPPYAQE